MNIFKNIKKQINGCLTYYFDSRKTKNVLLIINSNVYNKETEKDLIDRFEFYFKDINKLKIIICKDFSFWLYLLNPCVKLNFGFVKLNLKLRFFLEKFLFFDVDFNNNPEDGWNWHHALTAYTFSNESKEREIAQSKDIFIDYYNSIEKLEKSYILGTGPSLANAINIDWSNGYRIVCNTIVKDAELWQHVNPHFIVAGDAIYHFGHNIFAKTFLDDLKKRLKDSSTVFIYPFYYHSFLKVELTEFKNRLIPIPISNSDLIHISLFDDFRIPGNIGNVLNLLLLPLATTLSKDIYLFGFDGRAPTDQLFWANSSKHTYSDKISSIIHHHPKFFDFHVPKNGENKYVNDVHGEKLDKILSLAELEGWKFTMMHKTWTNTLAKRYVDN